MFEDLRNSFDFFVRSKTRFSRKNFVEKNAKLLERNKLENLYTKDVLSNYFTKILREKVRVLDIGCKNWFYAQGEYEFFKEFSKDVLLDGVEIDPYRLNYKFYSRYEISKYYTKGLEGINYICGNLLDINKKYDYIVWFLPFVVIEPHIFWGLPKKYFYPEKLLQHAYSLLNPEGEMLIINQGEHEANAQRVLLEKLGYNYKDLGEIESQYFEYKNKRYGFLVIKN